jgi:hypothetical protein
MFGEVPVPSRTPATVKAEGTGVLLLAGLSDLELNGKLCMTGGPSTTTRCTNELPMVPYSAH